MNDESVEYAGSGATGPDESEIVATESSVIEALATRAEQAEPSPDAYARLAERVSERESSRRWATSWLSTPRLLAGCAAAAMLVVGVGFGLLSGQDQVVSSVAPPPASHADPAVETDSEDDATPDRQPVADGSEEAEELAAAAAPVRPTPEGATTAMLELVGRGNALVEMVDEDVIITSRGEGGVDPAREIARAQLAEGDEGWSVVAITSEAITIDTPVTGSVVDGELTVEGLGSGFESTVIVSVISSTDGSLLAEAGGSAGQAAPEPFVIDVSVRGTDVAWLVVSGLGGADGVVEPFAAIPIVLLSADATPFTVVRVPLDDPDGGLNVRSEPGVGAEKLGVLPWGQTVTRTPGVFPARIGDAVWWKIEGGGVDGWVNSRFLADSSFVDDDDVQVLTRDFILEAGNPSFPGSWSAASPRLGLSVFARGGVTEFDPGELSIADGWTPELVAAIGLPAADLWTVGPTETIGFVEPGSERLADRYFGGQQSMTATYVGRDGRARRLHLFVESSPLGPLPIGAIVEEEPQSG